MAILKVKFIDQKMTKLTNRGKRLAEFNYTIARKVGLNKIAQAVKDEIKTYPDYKNLTFAVNVKIDNSTNPRKWFLSQFTNFDNFNLEQQFNYFVDSWSEYYTESKADRFQIIVESKKVKRIVPSKKAGHSDHNDCLYNCILQSYGYNNELLPSNIRKAYQFKRYLGYDRNDKVDLSEENLIELESILKCSFTIRGDIEYTSNEIKPVNINLQFKDNHVKLLCNEHRSAVSYERKPENIYSVYYDNQDIKYYNGLSIQTITYGEYESTLIDKKNFLIRSNTEEELKQTRKDYIKQAEYFKDVSKGLINFYKFNYASQIAHEIWRLQTKNITEPEALDYIEHSVLNQAFRGGLHYCQKGSYVNVIDYDMNSMYSNYMSSNNFTFPMSKPTYTSLTETDFNNLQDAFFSYGLYHIRVNSTHKFLHLPINKNIWVTHFDLEILKKLGVSFSVVTDSKFNCMLYPKRITGRKTFETYTNFMNKMINEVDDKYKPNIKNIRNSLWGYLSRKNTVKKVLKKDDELDISDYFMESYEPKESCTVVDITNRNEIYKSSWCRMSIFLTAYCRMKMMDIVLTNNTNDNILMINTDGFISLTELKLNIGSDMGQFKIKNKGDAYIHNSNKITWF
jgi:hypothetical protein